MVLADSIPVRALDTYVRMSGRNLLDSRYEHSDLADGCREETVDFPGTSTPREAIRWPFSDHVALTWETSIDRLGSLN